jgi:hypothetical protein
MSARRRKRFAHLCHGSILEAAVGGGSLDRLDQVAVLDPGRYGLHCQQGQQRRHHAAEHERIQAESTLKFHVNS